MRFATVSVLLAGAAAFASDASNNSAFIEPVVGGQTVGGSGVRWDGLARQSLLFMGIEHAFRLGTEPGTRGAKGPFFRSYRDSVGRLHGWSDGDPFYVNYVGHPMQGSVASFLWIQNDGNRRYLTFANTPEYWRSRLRAAGYSFVYSTLFEIGPASEASIGFIQSRYPQQGLVDHVVTPAIGLGWTVAEDIIDAKLITFLERHIENPWPRMLARGFLNPSRSFANMMRGQRPWHRDTRSGVFRKLPPAEYVAPSEPPRPEIPDDGVAPFELTAFGYRENLLGSAVRCSGGGASAAVRLSPAWQWVAEVYGCGFNGLRQNLSGDSLSYLTGPRWNPPGNRLRPFAHFLIGGRKITVEQSNPTEQARVEASKTLKIKGYTPEEYDEFARQDWSNALALSAATGVDVRIGRAAAVNLASLSYNRSWNSRLAGPDLNTGVQFSFGFMLRMGTW
jgi:hypothetical protein